MSGIQEGQWLHKWSLEKRNTRLETVRVFYNDSPSFGYPEIWQSSFMVEGPRHAGHLFQAGLQIAGMAQPSSSKRPDSIVGTDRVLSVQRRAMKKHHRRKHDEIFDSRDHLQAQQ